MGWNVPIILVPKTPDERIEYKDRTVAIPAGSSWADIRAIINTIGKRIMPGVTVTIQLENGTYSFDLTEANAPFSLNGFWGGGSVRLQGNPSDDSVQLAKNVVLSGDCGGSGASRMLISISNCRTPVYVRYLKCSLTSPGQIEWNNGIFIDNNKDYVDVEFCSFEVDTNNYGCSVFQYTGAYLRICSSYFKMGYCAMHVRGGAYGGYGIDGGWNSYNQSDSSKPKYGHWASEAGRIVIYDNSHKIEGSSGDMTENGGQIYS